jgi:transcriptional regulator with XRE-family HTH domain
MEEVSHTREQDMRVSFGKRVRHYRELRGWQQEDLALRIGKTKSNVSRIETGKQNVSVADIAAITSALEIRVADLFGDQHGDSRAREEELKKAAFCTKQIDDAVTILTSAKSTLNTLVSL